MNKALLYWLLYTVGLFILSFALFISLDDSAVNGYDALKIAASRPLYWVFIGLALAASIGAVIFAIKSDLAESGGGIHFLCFGIAALLMLTIFVAPANIKADPIGSGITKEQMKYVKPQP